MIEVIFLKDVPGVARKGEQKKVAPGYARNYLLPRNFAIVVNKKNLAAIQMHKQLIERRIQKEKQKLEELAKLIESKSVTIEVAGGTSESGKIFGAVTSNDIATALSTTIPEVAPYLDKHSILLKEPIKQPGTHTVTVVLYPHNIKSELKVWVIEKK